MAVLNQGLPFLTDLFNCGLLYAIARDRIKTPTPLDAETNWQFWTACPPDWWLWLLRHYPLQFQRQHYLEQQLQSDHAIGIAAHYDVSNDFYALFLDQQYRFYTCAEFLSDQDTLELAQTHKAAMLQSLLQLSGDEKILDLGCGWGAMLGFLQRAGHRGQLAGLTLSQEQLAYDRQLGLEVSLTNFITEPLPDPPYDRILSIGSFEHVKPAELSTVYQKVYDALTPSGIAVHQFFSFEREPYPLAGILMQIFFPGSLLVMHRDHLAIAKAIGFKITHDSIHDYKPTIKAWYDRLVSHQVEALDLVGLEVYNRYLTFFPIAWSFFELGESHLHRIVMEKSSTADRSVLA